MIRNLVVRDLKIRHRGTVLGMLWSLATPLATLATYSVVFTVVFKQKLQGATYPFTLYLFAGLLVWNLFAGSMMSATSSVVGASHFLRKLHFPRLILPIVAVLSTFVTFFYEFSVFLVFALAFQEWPHVSYLAVPLILLSVAMMAFGLGMMLATATVFLRDIPHFIGIIVQLMFFGTPIVYAASQFSPGSKFLTLIKLNPMYYVVEAFRDSVLNDHFPTAKALGIPFLAGTIFCIAGFQIFQRGQRRFAELV